MKLITLNAWGKNGPFKQRWDYFLEELAALKPDLLCLQEVIDDELTQRLRDVLDLRHWVSSYKAGLLILSQFPILDSRILSYQHCSSSEMNYERHAIITKIKIGKKELIIANTHLAWREEDRPTRDSQVRELLDAVKKTGFPTIICGDLNDTPESSPLKQAGMAGYENLIQTYHPGTITWDNSNPFIQTHSVKFPDRQIDYILTHESVSKILKPKTCRLAFNRLNDKLIYPSDHYGIFSEFETPSS